MENDHMKSIIVALDTENSVFVADAFKAVKIKFIGSLNEVESAIGFEPEFTHQYFGDTEKIIGYSDLSVSLCYSWSSLHMFADIKFQKKVAQESHLKADDIIFKIRDQLFYTQMDALISDAATFQKKLEDQKNFKPFGQLISNFEFVDFFDGIRKEMLVYKLDGITSEEADGYLQRAQSLALWYIDSAEYTDCEDPRFFHYIVFEASKTEDSGTEFKFAGYSSLYRFYCHPDMDRIRIAHFLVAPQYRHAGNGVKFLNAIYDDLRSVTRVYDITAETPAEGFLLMRDFADCMNCFDLPEYSKEALMKGFSKQMLQVARSKMKLHAPQARRVYEILRFHFTDPSHLDEYKQVIMKRIEQPLLKNSKRNMCMLSHSLKDQELAVVSRNMEPEQQRLLVKEICENTIESYEKVLDRLEKYEAKFQK